MRNLNKDQEKRDLILKDYFTNDKYLGGVRRFENITVDTLYELVENDFADREERHNFSPTINEFMTFDVNCDSLLFSGYAVDSSRDDYRISIDSIDGMICCTPANVVALFNIIRSADEASVKVVNNNTVSFSAWWD